MIKDNVFVVGVERRGWVCIVKMKVYSIYNMKSNIGQKTNYLEFTPTTYFKPKIR